LTGALKPTTIVLTPNPEDAMDLELAGKTALVTGGSSGIGKAIARLLAQEGAEVAIAARTESRLRDAAQDLAAATGARIVSILADTGDTASVNAMVEQAVAQLGSVEILVNNAARPGGGGPPPSLEETLDEAFDDEMNTKVLGYLRCARAVAPHMKARGWGRIINISGLAARQSGNAIGSMRNVAVAALTKNLADELGPFGINVTVVHPGLTWTERMPALIEARAKAQGIPVEQARQQLAAQNSARRVIDATDIAAVVAFLASPRSVAINGDAIAAGGGVGRAIHY
jgi:NAD(P)-dependent dehydrogenase (short-subunit alcohol dehydrogenase family)